MKIEFIGRGPIFTPAQLDEILFGTSTTNKKDPIEEALNKLLDDVKCDSNKKNKIGIVPNKTICFDIQSITANHKKNAFTVVWGDGSHTIVHLQPGDVWDNEKALAMCFVKHMMGDKSSFNDIFTKEMPAKIKHLGNMEPVEEKAECKCDTPCQGCSCHTEAEKAAAPYKVYIRQDGTTHYDSEHFTVETLRRRIHEIAEELYGRKPYYYRTWLDDCRRMNIDFGSHSQFIEVEGITPSEYAKN